MSGFRVVPTENLLHVWRALENLTVSLSRLGHHGRECGEAVAAAELGRHLSPELVRDIASARRMVLQALTEGDTDMQRHIEAPADDEAAVGYWQGPRPSAFDQKADCLFVKCANRLPAGSHARR